MAFTLRFPTLFTAFRHLGYATAPPYWGECPHCERTTPWRADPQQDEVRCTVCGQDCPQP